MASLSLYSPAMSPARFRYLIACGRRAVHLARSAHQDSAAERHRVLTPFTEHLEQPFALLAGRKQPAIFDAEHADRDGACTNKIEHLSVAHAGSKQRLKSIRRNSTALKPPAFAASSAVFNGVVSMVHRCSASRPTCAP